MSTAMSPYRQAYHELQSRQVPVKKTGLIPYIEPPPPHRCRYPETYTETKIEKKKVWLLFTRNKTVSTEHKVLPGSLYRCPECLKVAAFKKHSANQWSDPAWRITKEAAAEWLEKTGEYVDGES